MRCHSSVLIKKNPKPHYKRVNKARIKVIPFQYVFKIFFSLAVAVNPGSVFISAKR